MIDSFVRAFLRSSLVWLSLAIILALAMALWPSLAVYRTAHLHMALLGFVTQMIYGVALHVIPRFFGQPLVYPWLGGVQFWCAQAGLALMASGFALRVHGVSVSQAMLAAGGSSQRPRPAASWRISGGRWTRRRCARSTPVLRLTRPA